MPKPVVLLYEPIHEKALELLRQSAEVRLADSLEEDALLKIVPDVDGIIIRANGKVSRRLMQAAPHLKVVARHGTGVEAIDRVAAANLGIVVVNTPDANVESVAEQCLAFMIILSKRILLADRMFRAGDWSARYKLTGTEPYGKILGIIGFGRIGRRTAEMCHAALDMPVLYFDELDYPEVEAQLGSRKVVLDDLLHLSDYVSIHLPLLPTTQRIINAAALYKMKRTAFLINTSRGQVVDQAALIQALQEGWIAGAGLDVYDPEPLPPDNPLLTMDNVVLSPHMAAHTDEALFRMAMVIEDVLNVIEGRPVQNPVPPP